MDSIEQLTTQIAIRVLAKGGKFLGDDVGGASVTVKHAITQELLASGFVRGGSGDIYKLMVEERNRQAKFPFDDGSIFIADIKSDDRTPIPVTITANGPGAGLQSVATASTTQWIVPGLLKPITKIPVVYSCVLELSGLIVQVMQPATHLNVLSLPQTINFEVNVSMMCGCPIDNNIIDFDGKSFLNPWAVSDFYVSCEISCDGKVVQRIPLAFDHTNSPGRYTGKWTMSSPGFYRGSIIAYQKSNGNTGCATISFFNVKK
jgi:hypothetical protein